jgi:hypothetical protein
MAEEPAPAPVATPHEAQKTVPDQTLRSKRPGVNIAPDFTTKCSGASIGEKWGLFLARKSYQTKAPLVRRTREGDQPTVAVVIRAELRQPQCPTAGELLQCGTAGLQ